MTNQNDDILEAQGDLTQPTRANKLTVDWWEYPMFLSLHEGIADMILDALEAQFQALEIVALVCGKNCTWLSQTFLAFVYRAVQTIAFGLLLGKQRTVVILCLRPWYIRNQDANMVTGSSDQLECRMKPRLKFCNICRHRNRGLWLLIFGNNLQG